MSILREKNLSVIPTKNSETGDYSVIFQVGAEKIAEIGWTEATLGHLPNTVTAIFAKAQFKILQDEVFDVVLSYSQKNFPLPAVELD